MHMSSKNLEQKPKPEIAVESFKQYVMVNEVQSYNPFSHLNKLTKKKTLFLKDNFVKFEEQNQNLDNSFKSKS
jgi:hypothetical protein